MSPVPPRIPQVVRRFLDSIEHDAIVGDLEEEYLDFVLPDRGVTRAKLWFWSHLMKSVAAGALHGAKYRSKRVSRAVLSTPTGPFGRSKSLGEKMNTLFKDLKFGLRMVRKTPGVSAIAILAIALGVGITTHTFSIVYGSVIRGLPYEGADRLMHLERNNLPEGIQSMGVPIHDYLDWHAQQTVFDDLAAFYQGTVNVVDDDGQPERFSGGFISWNTFRQVGVEPLIGRNFREGEDQPGVPLTVMLGHNVWQTRYGGDANILGKTLRANGRTATIVGVMPEKFRFPFDEDLWMPLGIDAAQLERGDGFFLEVIGRLREGVTMEEAQTQMAGIAERLASAFPEVNEGVSTIVQSYVDEYMPPQITQILYLMLVAVFGVLLIACANVANLFLARAAGRTKEIAVRTALGAKRSRLISQLLVESTVLAVIGGLLGIVLAYGGITVFNAWIIDIQKPYWIDLRLDTTVMTFALIVTVVSGLVSGTFPAVKASGADVNEILKDENRGSSGFRMGRFSAGLVIAEIAVSCGLLVGAGLMIKSVAALKTFDLGFETEQVFTARVGLFDVDYPTFEDRVQFHDALVPRLEALPGVQAAALTTSLPGSGAGRWRFSLEGETYAEDRDQPQTFRNTVTPNYFAVFDVDFIEGNDFTVAHRADGLPVVIANQSFARRFFPGESALGKRIKFGASNSPNAEWRTIVGIVPDMWIGGGVGGIGVSDVPPEQTFVPLAQVAARFVSMAVRTQGPPSSITSGVRQVVTGLDATLPIYNVLPMNAVIEQGTWSFGIFGSLFTMFGVIALFLAAVGLYGVMAFSVSSRTTEMGIRIALGAVGADVMRLVLKKGMRQLAIGLTLGLALGFALSRPLGQFLFGINPSDLTVYAAVVVTLAATGFLAIVIPARRATRVNVVEALRPD